MYLARLTLAAEGVVVDRETNAISVFNILDRITAEGFPLLLQKMAFLVIWERSLEDAPQVEGRFSVHFSGRELYQQPVRVEFTTSTRNQFVLRMHGLVIPQPGVLAFRITLEGGVVAEYSVGAEAAAGAIRADVVQQPANPT
jgi:hypothetical protein